MDNIKFGYIDLPQCPFVWNYLDGFIHEIVSVEKHQQNIFGDIKNIIESIENKNDIEQLLKCNIDYYTIKQKILIIPNEKTKVNISFHSWYWLKRFKSFDMEKADFNVPLNTCLITKSKNILSDEIFINKITKRKINVHNNKLSPANSNTFYISDLNQTSDEENLFYSICYDTKIKSCVITQHIIYLIKT